ADQFFPSLVILARVTVARVGDEPPNAFGEAGPSESELHMIDPLRSVEGEFNEAMLGNARLLEFLGETLRRVGGGRMGHFDQVAEHGWFVLGNVMLPAPDKVLLPYCAQQTQQPCHAGY